jgi:hypothetical protein
MQPCSYLFFSKKGVVSQYLTDLHGIISLKTISRRSVKMANFYCKWCGEKYLSVVSLTNSSCPKSPSKKHEYEVKGAPSRQFRDDIVKLHRKGWDSEVIARAFDISKGEVELILELSTKD